MTGYWWESYVCIIINFFIFQIKHSCIIIRESKELKLQNKTYFSGDESTCLSVVSLWQPLFFPSSAIHGSIFFLWIPQKLMAVRNLTKQQWLEGSVCVTGPVFYYREFTKKEKSFCSGSYSLYVFNSLLSHCFKQTRFSYIIFYSFMSFSLFMPCIFICCFLIAKKGRQDAPLGTDG